MEKKCSKCLETKEINEFNKRKYSSDGYRSECRICSKIKRKDYYINNKKTEINNNTQYYNDNKIDILAKNKVYNKNNRHKRNTLAKNYRIKNSYIMGWRYVLGNTLKRLGKTKEGHTIDLLGYSATDLKQHLESLFTDGMSWSNYGEWHIDHIKTVFSFDKETPMNIVNALSNLRPLWATTREINGIIYEGNLNRPKF
jgi:hypothetical protein